MKRTLVILAALAAVSACGSSPASSAVPAGTPSAAIGSPSADLGGSSSADLGTAPLPSGVTDGAICSDVGVEVIAGDADPAGGAEAVYHISQAQVIAAVAQGCPDLSKDLP